MLTINELEGRLDMAQQRLADILRYKRQQEIKRNCFYGGIVLLGICAISLLFWMHV